MYALSLATLGKLGGGDSALGLATHGRLIIESGIIVNGGGGPPGSRGPSLEEQRRKFKDHKDIHDILSLFAMSNIFDDDEL